ncbi:hypothetical protein [Flammeovirga sp. EKP202]|uniref:coiled-coil domain-containing protein n=1 Tax=Flammeovirga sp. EKP202 TaxID=2770592 RepID=UPI00165F8ACA|nr:hypothetical protein [Flammeovirga sp. EKP202]MBD0402196.1 hypothetical protein [Flammeovirga sp. EKP202]
MFRNKLVLSLLALSSCMVSCQDDSIQSQIDDLSGKVEDLNSNLDSLDKELASLKEQHQNTLLEKIQEMDDMMASLIAENSKLSDQYSTISDSLKSIHDEVAESGSSIYYGDLLTSENFAQYTAQGASIVTGNVLVTTEEQLNALANLRVTGGNIHLSNLMDITLPALETVGGDLVVSSAKGSVVFENLFTVAGGWFNNDNSEQTSLVADKLAFVSGSVEINNNLLLETVSFETLAYMKSLSINSYWADDPSYKHIGALSNVEISNVDIEGDLTVAYGGTGTLDIGNVSGNLKLEKTNFTDINIAGTHLGGLELSYNESLVNLVVDNVKTIHGDIVIIDNKPDTGVGTFATSNTNGFETFPSFQSLTEIKGDINISGNTALTSIESFNAITSLIGSDITFNNNGTLTVLDIFNNITEASIPVSKFRSENTKVYIYEKTSWFNGFSNLLQGGDITIDIQNPTADDGGFGLFSTDVVRFEGFSSMTVATRLRLNIGDVTDFNAFNVLDRLQPGYEDYTYLSLQLPENTNVSLCPLSTLLTKIKNDELGNTNYRVYIQAINEWGWHQDVEDQNATIEELLSSCD